MFDEIIKQLETTKADIRAVMATTVNGAPGTLLVRTRGGNAQLQIDQVIGLLRSAQERSELAQANS